MKMMKKACEKGAEGPGIDILITPAPNRFQAG
jgi:hypothetical protein